MPRLRNLKKREILRAIHPPVNPTYRQAWDAIINGMNSLHMHPELLKLASKLKDPTCGDCARCFVTDDAHAYGRCSAYPPVVHTIDGRALSRDPIVQFSRPACVFFSGPSRIEQNGNCVSPTRAATANHVGKENTNALSNRRLDPSGNRLLHHPHARRMRPTPLYVMNEEGGGRRILPLFLGAITGLQLNYSLYPAEMRPPWQFILNF